MSEQKPLTNPEFIETLDAFRQYLTVRKDRDEATSKAYCYDVSVFADYYAINVDENLFGFTVTPDYIIGFSDYLKRKVNKKTNEKLKRSTIKRRLIGVYNFWKFLYRYKKIVQPPVSLDDLDIIIKKTTNPTTPLDSQSFQKLREELKNELLSMFN